MQLTTELNPQPYSTSGERVLHGLAEQRKLLLQRSKVGAQLIQLLFDVQSFKISLNLHCVAGLRLRFDADALIDLCSKAADEEFQVDDTQGCVSFARVLEHLCG